MLVIGWTGEGTIGITLKFLRCTSNWKKTESTADGIGMMGDYYIYKLFYEIWKQDQSSNEVISGITSLNQFMVSLVDYLSNKEKKWLPKTCTLTTLFFSCLRFGKHSFSIYCWAFSKNVDILRWDKLCSSKETDQKDKQIILIHFRGDLMEVGI